MTLSPKNKLEALQRYALDHSQELHPDAKASHKLWLLTAWKLYCSWIKESTQPDRAIAIEAALNILEQEETFQITQRLKDELLSFFVLLMDLQLFFNLSDDEKAKADIFYQQMFTFLSGSKIISRIDAKSQLQTSTPKKRSLFRKKK